ncbi:MAG: aldo/keto reductase [Myxococcota bacterium]|nr:aldo/keto reductase [Myxococcota bacterium]
MNFGQRTSAAESERIVRRAIDRGLVCFDTADAYNGGESERILGRALAGARERTLVASKVGMAGAPKNPEGLSRGAILRAIDGSLTRLGTDHVDLYYLHAPDRRTPIEETIDAMKALLDAGKVRAWGVSNYASWQILEINALCDQLGMQRPKVSQVIYNLLIRQIEMEYVPFAARFAIHTTVYNPLAGGLLAGKHRRDEIPAGSRFDGNQVYQRRYWSDRLLDHVDALSAVAKDFGMTLVELAYAWLATRPAVDSILVGPADVGQLDAAIDACSRDLSQEAVTRLDDCHYAFAGTDATYAR